jgi:tripartite ATP-independent transporter DctM subunit
MIWLLFIPALLGLPLFLAMGLFALCGFSLEQLPHSIYFAEFVRIAANPTLIAIPLFTLAGFILAESRAPERLVNLATSLLGWLPGGLAVVTVLVMALLTAFTGASGVTIVALGGLMLPALMKGNYTERFGIGLLTTSGSLGLLFPPSLPLILFGIVAEVPIDKLFLAGIIPGFIMVLGMGLYSAFRSPRRPAAYQSSGVSILTSIKAAIWEIPLPIVAIGGIYAGLFTASDAAIVTVFYVLLVEVIIKRDVKWGKLPEILAESSVMVGGILMILGSALALTNYFIFADIPSRLLEWIGGTLQSKFSFLLALNLFLLVVGCLMDIFSALVVVVPLILPLAVQYGVDPIHLGIIFLANLEIGYSTPPIGLNLFISSFTFRKPVLNIYSASMPFLVIQLIILALLTYIPELTSIIFTLSAK